jgi:DNA topoisomerase IA
MEFLQGCIGAAFTVNAVEKKPGKRTPAAPFTTSTLQQEASRKLGYGVDRTMRIAQGLYEQGHITYMRTDSVNLSEGAIAAAEVQITAQYGAATASPPLHQQEQGRPGSARSHPPCGHDGAQAPAPTAMRNASTTSSGSAPSPARWPMRNWRRPWWTSPSAPVPDKP